MLVSFSVNALFTSIQVEVVLHVIYSVFINVFYEEVTFKYGHTIEGFMDLLKCVLNNCVFSFQGKFYKQL